jgi:hypothetical protein
MNDDRDIAKDRNSIKLERLELALRAPNLFLASHAGIHPEKCAAFARAV